MAKWTKSSVETPPPGKFVVARWDALVQWEYALCVFTTDARWEILDANPEEINYAVNPPDEWAGVDLSDG